MARRDLAREAGKFVKHVVPAAMKPIHVLWHEVIGFIFLVIAGVGAWKVYGGRATMGPVQLLVIVPLIVVSAAYGVSSFLKARRISRS